MEFPVTAAWREGVQVVWDATSLSLIQSCPRKYQYKLIEGWRPHRTSVHLRFGQHYASALEHYFKFKFDGMDHDQAERAVVREALQDTWDRSEADPVGKPWFPDDPNKNRETLIRTIIWYLEEFKDDPVTVKTLDDGRPAVEHSFIIPVENNLFFSGHLDRVVEFAGETYVQDQKTTKATVSQYYFEEYDPNIQMSMYTFAGQIILNAPIKGVMLDVAQIAVGFTRFARGFTFRSKSQLDEWYEDTMQYIELAHAYSRAEYFPMNAAACGNYGGCEFRKICSRGKSVRGQFLQADFIKAEPWNPAEKR